MPDKLYTQTTEFRLSDELFESVNHVSSERGLTLKQFAIASVGLLNETRPYNFRTNETLLIVDEHLRLPIPSLVAKENEWPHLFTVSLKPKLYDPMADYVRGRRIDVNERARRALRFGAFVLSHVAPYEDEDIMFWNNDKLVAIPYRTQQ